MTELDQVIANAYGSEGKQEDVNKVYLTLLRTLLYLPVSVDAPKEDEEPFRPLFTKVDDHYFVLAFDTEERLKVWSGEYTDKMNMVAITGKDLISGINDNVYVGINYGSEFYKEFSPDEVKKLKMIVARIDAMKGP